MHGKVLRDSLSRGTIDMYGKTAVPDNTLIDRAGPRKRNLRMFHAGHNYGATFHQPLTTSRYYFIILLLSVRHLLHHKSSIFVDVQRNPYTLEVLFKIACEPLGSSLLLIRRLLVLLPVDLADLLLRRITAFAPSTTTRGVQEERGFCVRDKSSK